MVGSLIWGLVGSLFDSVGSNLAGLKSKNMSLGYGKNIDSVLTYRAQRKALDDDYTPPDIVWDGPWKEIDFDQVTKSKSWLSATQLALKMFDAARYLLNGRDKEIRYKKLIIRDGRFRSPLADLLPDRAKDVVFRIVLPLKEGMVIDNEASGLGVNFDGQLAVHFAATGDEGFSIRQGWYANPLAAMDGVGSVIHIQSYYGKRRQGCENTLGPQTSYPTVGQTITMGYATIVEGKQLVKWLVRDPQEGGLGFQDRVCLTGVSLGGAMAGATACESQERVAVASCMPSHGASIMAKGGALSKTVDWKVLIEAGQAPIPEVFDKLMDSSVSRNPTSQTEAQDLLHEIFEESTSVKDCPKPVLPEAMILVAAKGDQYCPPASLQKLSNHVGEKAEVRWIPGGHVTGFLLMHRQFRQAVVDSLQKLTDLTTAGEITLGRDAQAGTIQSRLVDKQAGLKNRQISSPTKISA